MSDFCEDDQRAAQYPQGIFGRPRPQNSPLIRCLQWGANVQNNERDITFQSANELTDTAVEDRLRVIFMPNCTQATSDPDVQEFKKLYKYYSVPSDVLTERTRMVNHSFGSSQAIDNGAHISWCHFVCRKDDMQGRMIWSRGYLPGNYKGGQPQTSSGLDRWIRCDFFLHVAEDKSVTLLCFGAPDSISLRFENIVAKTSWIDVLQEPNLLFVIIFDELHEIFDLSSRTLMTSLNRVNNTFNKASAAKSSFEQLHYVQKWVLSSISGVTQGIGASKTDCCL
jgi:hypothetical protein